jgi:hypothetical protein
VSVNPTPAPRCSCASIKVDGHVVPTAPKNWNPDCPAHGVRSPWYGSEAQQDKRDAQNERLRDLYAQVRAARRRAAAGEQDTLAGEDFRDSGVAEAGGSSDGAQ